MHRRNMVFGIAVLVALFALAGSLISAEPLDRDLPPQEADAQLGEGVEILGVADQQPYQYMVKYVCGNWVVPYRFVAVGQYVTSINVYNYTDVGVRIYKRPATMYTETGLPSHEDTGTYPARVHVIRPRKVLAINCEDIYSLLGYTEPTIMTEGFVQISMAQKLPVVAVYTSSAHDLDDPVDYYPDSGPGIDVEYIVPFIEP